MEPTQMNISGEIFVSMLAIILTIVISIFAGFWTLLTFLKGELKSLSDKMDEMNKTISKVEKDYMTKSDCRIMREECPSRAAIAKLEKLCES